MMTALIKLCLHLLFWQRILRGLFLLGACLVLPGAMWWWSNPDSTGGPTLMAFGSGIALLFPVMLMPLAFRQLISGRHVAMVPNLRRLAGASLLLLCMLITLWCALLAVLNQHAQPVPLIILLFSVITGYWLLVQWMLRHKWSAVASWLVLILLVQLPGNKAAVAWAMGATVNGLLLLLSVAAWLVFARWLHQTRLIHMPRFVMDQLQNPELHQQQHQAWLDGKLSFGSSRSASGSVLRGAYDNWRNRLSLQFLAFFLFPVLLNVIFEVLDYSHGSKRQRSGLSTDSWLSMGVFGSTMISFYTREWLARTRLLWLRGAGDRRQIWQRVQRMTQQETLITLLISGLYFGLVAGLSDVSVVLAGAVTVLCTSAVWFSVNVGHLARLRGWSWVAAVAQMVLLILLLMATVAMAQQRSQPLLPVAVAAAFAVLGTLAAEAGKRRFVRVDWCQLRPLSGRTPATDLR